MKSSYLQDSIAISDFFQAVSLMIRPETIVEIGILDGFSLTNLTKNAPNSKVLVYDLFDDFNGNSANLDNIKPKFPLATIRKGDFYKVSSELDDSSIDILHIDIGNDGDVYEFALTNYINKLTPKGVMLLEGGSKKRDEVEWMLRYNKKRIQPLIKKFKNKFKILNIGEFPSLTIVAK